MLSTLVVHLDAKFNLSVLLGRVRVLVKFIMYAPVMLMVGIKSQTHCLTRMRRPHGVGRLDILPSGPLSAL